MFRSFFAAAAAALVSSAAFALDCPKPEAKHRSEISGEQSCLAAIVKGAPVCGTGRKSRALNRAKQQFVCEADPAFGAKCPAPEEHVKDRFNEEYCKPSSAGQCGPGRKHQPHHKLASVSVCVPAR